MKKDFPESPKPRKRLGWLRREGIDLGDAVVQFFSVLLGVLLALLISQWTNHRQQQAKVQATLRQQQVTANDAMRAIHAELASNRVALREHASRMFAMAKRMQDSPQNRNKTPRFCYLWNQWRGIGGLNLVDAAYQTSIATQALANMPFAQAHKVAEVYGWQHYFQRGIQSDVHLMLDQRQTLDFCVGLIEEIGRGDLGLDKQYDPLIGQDKAKLPTPPPYLSTQTNVSK
ncbi:MAG TPA: hypothetical protein VF269_00060 [Rhodanobacteraceae bacterium]